MTIADSILPRSQAADVWSIPDKRLFRAGLLLLLFMTTAFGTATWNSVQDLSGFIKAIPVVLYVVVCVLVVRLYATLDKIGAVQHSVQYAAAPVQAANAAQVPLETCNKIWSYWDQHGTGRPEIEKVRGTYSMSLTVVQQLLEQYDVRWREQTARLYCENPANEYTLYTHIDQNQVAEDALRVRSGLPIYPVAGMWLCSACGKRPCGCDPATPKDIL